MIHGEQDKINHVLSAIDPTGLQSLVFSHCPRLEMPSHIQAFTNLKRIKIFNSSISAWDLASAVSAETTPLLGTVMIVEFNLSTIPEGILHANLPRTLSDVLFSGTNLSHVPDDAYMFWSHIQNFGIEATPMLTEIPRSVGSMNSVVALNLVNNSIASIPDQLFAGNAVSHLILDGNPLDSLPPTLGSPMILDVTKFQHTNVAQIPLEWFTLYANPNIFGRWQRIFARSSPLCTGLARGDYSSVASNSMRLDVARVGHVAIHVGQFLVDCTSSSSQRLFPLEAEVVWRQKNQ